MTRIDKKAQTRAKILAAARTVFDTLGYTRATLRDIARTAELSTGAIFSADGFPAGKDQLYAEVYGHAPITPEQGRAMAVRFQHYGIKFADAITDGETMLAAGFVLKTQRPATAEPTLEAGQEKMDRPPVRAIPDRSFRDYSSRREGP